MEVTDVEDDTGHIRDALVWWSHLSGELARGPQLGFNATELPQGFHIITVMVTDSGGATASLAGVMYVQHSADEFLDLAADAMAALSLDATSGDALAAALDGFRGGECPADGALSGAVASAAETSGTTPTDAALLRALGELVPLQVGCVVGEG